MIKMEDGKYFMYHKKGKKEKDVYIFRTDGSKEYHMVGIFNINGFYKGKRTRYFSDGVSVEMIEKGEFFKFKGGVIEVLTGEGVRIEFNAEGRETLKYEGEFKKGFFNGRGKLKWDDGNVKGFLEGTFKDGKFAEGKKKWDDEKMEWSVKQDGMFRNGKIIKGEQSVKNKLGGCVTSYCDEAGE